MERANEGEGVADTELLGDGLRDIRSGCERSLISRGVVDRIGTEEGDWLVILG